LRSVQTSVRTLKCPPMRVLGLIAVVFLCLALAACGDDDSTAQPGGSGTTTSESQTQSGESKPTESDAPIPTGKPGRKLTKPSIPPPTGPPPKEIVIVDLVEGTGPEAKKGDELKVEFFAVDKAGKERFSSWRKKGEPFYTFELGADELFPTWDEGFKGMRVGGRREVIYPASGTNKLGDLYYVVDLLKIE
jgi:peptidylprolyl isomerase